MRISLTLASGILWAAASLSAQTWQLVWSDEFNGAANTQPDPTKWTYDTGNNGWGNNELENYTDLAENAHMDGLGHLDIHVENPSAGVYTSARIKTEGLFATQYGRIEARIKLPFGQGIWPAFWMLGTDITTVSWPQCGEIDIMENIGSTPSINYGSVHAPNYNVTAQYPLANGQKLSDDFHTFAIQWSAQSVTFYVDGSLLSDHHSVGRRKLVGIQHAVLYHPERRGGRYLSGISGRDHPVSAGYAHRLRARLPDHHRGRAGP